MRQMFRKTLKDYFLIPKQNQNLKKKKKQNKLMNSWRAITRLILCFLKKESTTQIYILENKTDLQFFIILKTALLLKI